MAAPAMTAGSNGRSVMGSNLRTAPALRNLNGRQSVDVRLSERWGCQVSTARARRQRVVDDLLAVVEETLAVGDTDGVGHILALLDATLAGQPGLPKLDALYDAADADTAEDVAEARFRRNPCRQTARALLDAMGREARCNPAAMAWLRREYAL